MTQNAASTSLPIACSLGAGDYTERLAWVATLNRDALRSQRRDGRALELTYAPSAEERVRELVRRERACCAFLDFSLDVASDAVRLRIAAPREAGDSLDVLFEPFLGGTPDARVVAPTTPVSAACESGCGCETSDDAGASAHAAETTNADRRIPGFAATSTAVAALACGVCCALPFALPATALATFGGVFAAAARAYWWALGVAVLAVAGAWLGVGWQSARTGRRPARSTLVTLGAATAVLLAASSWSFVESRVITWLRG